MKEFTLKIKNDHLADSVLNLISKIKDIEIVEDKKRKRGQGVSKIDQLLENPYDIEDFKIYTRAEIYERHSIS